MTRVVLGSASRGRLAVLRRAGIDPLVIVSGVDEDALIASLGPGCPPGDAVCALAAAKAEDVVPRLPAEVGVDCVVIGCDSMLGLDGRLHGKPGSPDAVRRQWRAMAGRAATLHTGHAVLRVSAGAVAERAVESGSTTVHFAEPSDVELDAYVATGEPAGVAGGFTLDGHGGWFVDRIEGDPSNVIGLSLPLTRRLLDRVGVPLVALW